jgi:hypothetical protein
MKQSLKRQADPVIVIHNVDEAVTGHGILSLGTSPNRCLASPAERAIKRLASSLCKGNRTTLQFAMMPDGTSGAIGGDDHSAALLRMPLRRDAAISLALKGD